MSLSPEDKEARAKGLSLVARIECLMQTNENFCDWLQKGLDEIEAGNFVVITLKEASE